MARTYILHEFTVTASNTCIFSKYPNHPNRDLTNCDLTNRNLTNPESRFNKNRDLVNKCVRVFPYSI